MNEFMIGAGVLCLITAIIGGGVELSNIGKMPVVNSLSRQGLLALLGLLLVGYGAGWNRRDVDQNTSRETIPLSENERYVAELTPFTVHVAAGDRFEVDQSYGQPDAPPCANLSTHVTWKVRSPESPPAEVAVYSERMGDRELLGHGPSGHVDHGGCVAFYVENKNAFEVIVSVRTVIAELLE